MTAQPRRHRLDREVAPPHPPRHYPVKTLPADIKARLSG
jgi:hypothetical protein